MPPNLNSALPPTDLKHEASPKAISKRTSYLRVRLEFLSYPQVIHLSCNTSWFGPPIGFTLFSTCSWVAHPVSGLVHGTWRRLRLAFATPPGLTPLGLHHTANSLAHSTKGRPSPLRAPTHFKQRISGSISLPFLGCFSPFPHGTCSLSISKLI